MNNEKSGSSSVSEMLKNDEFQKLMDEVRERKDEQPALELGKQLSEEDTEYPLITRCNSLVREIDDEMMNIHRFVRDIYSKKFPELESIVTSPLDYLQVVQRIGNTKDLTTIDFSDILPNTAVMAITVTASMTAGTQLPRQELDKMLVGCDEAFLLNDCKRDVLLYLESRMSGLAPNLSALLGAALAVGISSCDMPSNPTNMAVAAENTAPITENEEAARRDCLGNGEAPFCGEEAMLRPAAMPGLHVQLFRRLQAKWQCYDAYCRVCMALGVNQILQGLTYYAIGIGRCPGLPQLCSFHPMAPRLPLPEEDMHLVVKNTFIDVVEDSGEPPLQPRAHSHPGTVSIQRLGASELAMAMQFFRSPPASEGTLDIPPFEPVDSEVMSDTLSPKSSLSPSSSGQVAGSAMDAMPIRQDACGSNDPADMAAIYMLHQRRECTPCLFHTRKKDGCWKGDACHHCHFCTKKEASRRRNQMKSQERKDRKARARLEEQDD
eukprot:s579_g30.t3